VVAHNDGTPCCAGSIMLCPPVEPGFTYKCDIGQRIQRGQLSDCIQQKDSARQRLAIPSRSPAVANRHLLQQSHHGREPFRMPRRQIIAARGCCTRIFSNAFSSSDSSPSTVLPHTSTAWRRPSNRRRTVSTIAGGTGAGISNFKLPLTRTRSGLAPISCRRMASSAVWARNISTFAEQLPHPSAEAPVPRPRVVRDARIHHRNPRSAGMRQPEKIGPELGFRNHHHLRPQCPQIRTNRECEIHREIKTRWLRQSAGGPAPAPCPSFVETKILRCEPRRSSSAKPATASNFLPQKRHVPRSLAHAPPSIASAPALAPAFPQVLCGICHGGIWKSQYGRLTNIPTASATL